VATDDWANDNTRILMAQQNAGSGYNQTIALSLALGEGPGVALSDADLIQSAGGNTVENGNFGGTATLEDAANGNTGINVIQQAGGTFGNQGVGIGFSGVADHSQ
jgi:hypothetical protein